VEQYGLGKLHPDRLCDSDARCRLRAVPTLGTCEGVVMAKFKVTVTKGYLGPYPSLKAEFSSDDLSDKLSALKASLAKWEFIVKWVKENEEYLDEGGAATCALCQFHPGWSCSECLIGDACSDTPYYEYSTVQVEEVQEALRFAQEEVEFLQELLEIEEDEDGS